MASYSRSEIVRRIDHTVLKPETTAEQIDQLCSECREYGFVAACVNPVWVPRCVEKLKGSRTVVATVAGFPLGASQPAAKAQEARLAVEQGALEVDMVINLAALIGKNHAQAVEDVAAVVASTKKANPAALVKVILETRALTEEQIVLGCRAAAEAKADFVKTSTGFHPNGGATVEHVALMKRSAGGLKVKASGGIRDLDAALKMLAAGADRLGMSASVAVARGLT